MHLTSHYPEVPPLPEVNVHHYCFERPEQSDWKDYTLHINAATDQRRSFRAFIERVRDAATALGTPVSQGGLGLRNEDGEVIGIMSENSMEYITLVHACLAITTPFSLLSSYSTAFELKHALMLSKTTTLFVTAKHLSAVLPVAKEIGLPLNKIYILGTGGRGRKGFVDMIDEVTSKRMPRLDVRPARKNTLAYLVFSSGTSGLPKAVMITHGNIIFSLGQMVVVSQAIAEVFTPPPPVNPEGIPINLAVLPMYHTYGLHTFCFRAFLSPRTILILSKWDINIALRCIPKYKVSILTLVPSLVHQVVHHPKIHEVDLSSLSNLHSGAAYLPTELSAKLAKLVPKEADISEGYGMSETVGKIYELARTYTKALQTVSAIIQPFPGVLGGLKRLTGCTGILLPGMEARIVRDDGTDADFDEPGELWLQAENIAPGYFNNEKANKETFVDGWLHTGDKFRVNRDGYFFFADRAKDTLKVSGAQVSPVEIEDILLAHPSKLIIDATVAGVSGGRTTDERIPRAWIVLSREGKKAGAASVIKQLEAWHRENLSKFKWLRGGIEIVNEIPKSPTGKVLRRELQDKYEKRIVQQAKSKL